MHSILGNNADDVYSEIIRTEWKEYEDMKMPGNADTKKPCGSTIRDVDKVLGLYLKGDCSTRRSVRISFIKGCQDGANEIMESDICFRLMVHRFN